MKLIEINIKINFKEKFPKTYKRYVIYRFRRYLKKHFSLGVWREKKDGRKIEWGGYNENAYYYLPFLRKYTNDGTIKKKYDIMKIVDLKPILKEFAQNEEVKLLKYINKKL